ncbi:cell wall metabolism sensor histidine kinase WalK [Anaerosalibacter bizertensis]|uniref:sensor histidine kinase n=1 Tax=Anaerosalibacter bizertensis TaxID=932217 RepID=UPI001C0E9716|nr:ATP-binding protein [Anaerosalibacter bizertensis]MBU5294035.1 cell wall metabolism sensor histidine kinase WalK [Anaerosalibacter bizertensis]
MVTILEVNHNNKKRFVSVRWKLVSTYLLLIFITLIIINLIICKTIFNIYIDQEKNSSFTKANIVSNRVRFQLASDRMSEEWIQTSIRDYSKEINSRIIVVDKDNKVQLDSHDSFVGDKFYHDEIVEALKGENSSGIYNFKQSGRVMYISVPVIVNNKIVGAVLLSTSIEHIHDEVKHIWRKLELISGISMIVIAIIVFLFAGVILKPLNDLKNTINKVTQGHLEEKVNIKSNDEFKEVAEAFNMMITKLEEVDNQRKDFVANVSHELRTPLTSIKILSESLINQDTFDKDIYKEFLIDIDSEVDRLNNIITDLLTLVNLDKEKLILDNKVTYINYLLEKIVSRMEPIAKQKNIELKLILNEKIQIKIDEGRMQQAIINIIDNAIKYTQPEGIIEVELYKKEKHAIIKILDNGVGIPEDKLPYIFERFYRVDKARSRNTGGTGLGLSIAWEIITSHGGTIDVDSQVGVGSIFYIKLSLEK